MTRYVCSKKQMKSKFLWLKVIEKLYLLSNVRGEFHLVLQTVCNISLLKASIKCPKYNLIFIVLFPKIQNHELLYLLPLYVGTYLFLTRDCFPRLRKSHEKFRSLSKIVVVRYHDLVSNCILMPVATF